MDKPDLDISFLRYISLRRRTSYS